MCGCKCVCVHSQTHVQTHPANALHPFADTSVNVDDVDASANARRCVHDRFCRLLLSDHRECERYLALSCGQKRIPFDVVNIVRCASLMNVDVE